MSRKKGQRSKLSDEGQQVAFRLPTSLVKRLDAYAQQMSRHRSGVTFTITRADAARALLTYALEHLEEPHTVDGSSGRHARRR
jgi:hypothetical protein